MSRLRTSRPDRSFGWLLAAVLVAAFVTGCAADRPRHNGTATLDPQITSDEDVDRLLPELSNWGRWGADDQLGTINFITAERVFAARELIRSGVTVSLARLTSILDDEDVRDGDYELSKGEYGSRDRIGATWHGFSLTHIDALCHAFANPDQMFNGFSTAAVSTAGAARLGIDVLARKGISGRGVLLDIARLRGAPLEPGTAIFPADLDAAAAAQGVEVRTGDILFVRTGAGSRNTRDRRAGLHPSCLPWVFRHQIAVLGGDGDNDAHPIHFERWASPFHSFGIPYLGLPLIDNAELDDLAERCQQEGRWEFFVVIAPWRIQGATSSPVNPIAVF